MQALLDDVRTELLARTPELIATRRELHMHPELSFAEHRTAALVADRLRRASVEVITGVGGTGVIGVVRGDRPGRTVAWRADMDALPLDELVDVPFRSVTPEVMHACGHDGHTAIAISVAETLAAHRASLPGTAVFLFQPGEEVLAGAQKMVAAGVLDTYAIEEIYSLHLSAQFATGEVQARAGIAMASADFLEIAVTGRGGHGAEPELALDPIAIAAQIVLGLPQLVTSTVPAKRAAVLTVGQFLAGHAANVIPEVATLRGSLRSFDPADRRALLDRATTFVQGVAAAHGARATLRTCDPSCPALVNHKLPTDHVHACARAELGDDHVREGEPNLASDDMSVYLAERPGCYFRVGAAIAGRAAAPAHSPQFEIDEQSLSVGARVAAAVLVRSLGAV